ncbi:MAG: polysaccharide deacetylase family protein [Hyphomicrobiaceae bacterium]
MMSYRRERAKRGGVRLRSLLAGAAAALGAVLTIAALPSPAAAEGSQQLLSACFAPADLLARPGEKAPRKGQRAFDAPEPARKLATPPSVPALLRGAIRRVRLPAGQKLVALTLDLCEQPGEIAGYDGEIIDYLRREGVKATLFVGGKWLRSHEQRARQLMADPLFEIANHSAAHRNLRLLSGDRLKEEIEAPQRAYEAIREDFSTEQCVRANATHWRRVPQRMGLFRFPFGACNDAALAAVNDAGLLAIQWDVSTGDPTPQQSAAAIAREILRATRPGSIVIGHANGRGFHTAAALPLAIPKLKAQGYRFVTVSELLAAGTPEVVATCYNQRPGDTDRYDDLATAFRKRAPKTAPASSGVFPFTTPTAPPRQQQPRRTTGTSRAPPPNDWSAVIRP